MFNGKRIRQARELRRLTQGELARLIGKSQAAIAHVERGFKEPSAELVSAVAVHTHFPISFFTTVPPVEFPGEVLLFRARATMTRRDAQAAARYAEVIFEMGQNKAANHPQKQHGRHDDGLGFLQMSLSGTSLTPSNARASLYWEFH